MFFFFKRLLYRLIADKYFLWVALIPPLVYLGIMAMKPSVYTLTSTFAVPDNAPLARTGDPTGVVPLSPLVSSPADWDTFVKNNFNAQRIMGYPRGYGLLLSAQEANAIYMEALTHLTVKEEGNQITTTYIGGDKDLGNRLVFYYSTTLFQRVQEGYKRQGSHLTPPLTEAPQMAPGAPAQRLLWSNDRALPALRWLMAGIVILLFVQAVRELTDTSFKSEKQIAEHTQLPILGSLPNLNSVPVPTEAPHQPS